MKKKVTILYIFQFSHFLNAFLNFKNPPIPKYLAVILNNLLQTTLKSIEN